MKIGFNRSVLEASNMSQIETGVYRYTPIKQWSYLQTSSVLVLESTCFSGQKLTSWESTELIQFQSSTVLAENVLKKYNTYLSDPLGVPSECVETCSSWQSPHFDSIVCRTADQCVQLIIVVYTEHWEEKKPTL